MRLLPLSQDRAEPTRVTGTLAVLVQDPDACIRILHQKHNGAHGRNRTYDLLLRRQTLYPLSYVSNS